MNKRTLLGALALTTALVVPGAIAQAIPLTTAPAGVGHDYEPLRDAAERSGRYFGFAYAPHLAQQDANYRAIAEREFSMVTAENTMKWESVQPSEGQFNWSGADAVVDFAQANNQEVYGHTLVWHSQLPGWASNISDPTRLSTVMKDHINAVAGRYKGDIAYWDVVNEAFEDNGTRRQSVFQRVLGDGYIEEAFREARSADPNAKLCINDYSTDAINSKSTAIYNLVRDFKARGVPIDCVGLQSHLIVGQVPSTYQQNIQRFVDLGVEVRITELDIRMNTPASQQNIAQQAQDYKKVFEACWAVDGCNGVTIWGISDQYSWIPDVFPGEGAALPWNSDYSVKPALAELAQVMGATTGGSTPDPTDPPTDPTDPPTDPTDPPTDPTPGACEVTASVNSWNSGYTATVTIKNTSSQAINGWELTAALPAGHSLAQGWNAVYTQSGSTLSARNVAWNSTLAPGASVSIGFNADFQGSLGSLSGFTLNGAACN